MKKLASRVMLLLTILVLSFALNFSAQAQIVSPEKHYGFKPGADRMLFNYDELIAYLDLLDEASPKLKMVNIGTSPNGKPMYIAFISSAKNIANLDRLKEINKALAKDPNLTESEVAEMVEEGKVFLLATLSMHSTEVGPAQAAPLIAYELITSEDEDIVSWLDEVVYMMVPNHNPDGMDMIVNNYLKYKGTKYEGSSMPGVYHKYVGHDNNRDFVILTQDDSKAIAAIYNLDWFPQVMVEKHQMGSTGVRYTVAPPHDPIAQNVDGELWSWINLFGTNATKDMTKEGLTGIANGYIFDDYWPGATETCIWKNVIGLLTEAASVKTASPIYIEPNELRVGGKGLSEYKKGINFLKPWPGGWWRLGDIVDYEISSTKSFIRTSFLHNKDILKFRNDMAKSEVLKGKTEAPYFYVMPKNQRDQSELVDLVRLMIEHGIDVFELTEKAKIGFHTYAAGDIVIPMAQAFRPFIKEVMEKQVFPVRHYQPDGEVIRPYDIASWSLPLHRNVKAYEINDGYVDLSSKLKAVNGDYTLNEGVAEKFHSVLLSVNNNESFRVVFAALSQGTKVERLEEAVKVDGKNYPKGSFILKKTKKSTDLLFDLNVTPTYLSSKLDVKTSTLSNPRIALVETNMHDMDAGWTRYIFDTYKMSYTVLKPDQIEAAKIADNYDIMVFPNTNKDILKSGKYKSKSGEYSPSRYPPEYAKGMGAKGMEAVMSFVDQGGIIVSWGQSTGLFEGTLKIKRDKETEEFSLPFRNIGSNLQKAGLYCPGSLVKIKLKQDHPLTMGLPKEIGVFFRGNPVFSTSIPRFDMDRRAIATLPEKNILMSGYMEKEELLSNKTVMLWMKKGKGQFVLYGFGPQFRASTQASFKLLFNALLLPKL